jgi:hypothetical protein
MDLLKKKRGYEIGMFWWSPFFSKDSKDVKTSKTSREFKICVLMYLIYFLFTAQEHASSGKSAKYSTSLDISRCIICPYISKENLSIITNSTMIFYTLQGYGRTGIWLL